MIYISANSNRWDCLIFKILNANRGSYLKITIVVGYNGANGLP